MTERVRLLLAHGVSPDTEVGGRYEVARMPAYAAALTTGHPDLAEVLAGHGASTGISPEQAVLAAVLSGGDVEAAAVADAISTRPGLVVWAAQLGRGDAVRRAVELGWDVDRRARIDVPSDQEWETALHAAAGNGDVAMVRLLLDLGADATLEDCRFDAEPHQWAEHFGHAEVVGILNDRSG